MAKGCPLGVVRVKVASNRHHSLGRVLTHRMVKDIHALENSGVPAGPALEIGVEIGKTDDVGLLDDQTEGDRAFALLGLVLV